MSQYTTKTAVENYTLLKIDDSFNSALEGWIESVSEMIENRTNRVFIASDSEERVFDGNNKTKLVLPDFVELTSVEVDNKDVTSSVLKYPPNELPYTSIYYENGFYRGKQNVTVGAKWGYSVTVPKAIEMVATVMVAGIIQDQEKTDKAIVSERIGNYQVKYTERQFEDFKIIDKTLSAFKRYPL